MFWSQVIASAVAGTVQLGVMNWMFSNIPYVQTIILPSPSMELNSILPPTDICVNLNRWNCTFLSPLPLCTSQFRSRKIVPKELTVLPGLGLDLPAQVPRYVKPCLFVVHGSPTLTYLSFDT